MVFAQHVKVSLELGHAQDQSPEIYAHIPGDHLRDTVNILPIFECKIEFCAICGSTLSKPFKQASSRITLNQELVGSIPTCPPAKIIGLRVIPVLFYAWYRKKLAFENHLERADVPHALEIF